MSYNGRFRTAKLGPLCRKIGSGATPRGGKDSYLEAGPCSLIRSQNVYNNRFAVEGLAFISAEQAEDLRNVEVTHGDVLLNITGDSVARCCQAPSDILPARVNQHVAIIRPDANELDPKFLHYFLTSPQMQAHMLMLAGAGATRNALTKGMIENFDVPKPDIVEQHAIAQVLGALDDKIELNLQMNETLEALTRTLFCRNISNGRAIRVGKFEQLAALRRETINPSDFPDEIFDHYSIPAFDEGRWPKSETSEQIKSNKFLVPTNAVMISKLNPRIPRIWMPSVGTATRSVASTEFLVAIPKAGISREWLYGLFTFQPFLDVFTTLVTGTSGSHQRVKPEYLLSMDVKIPPTETIQRYTKAVAPLHERIGLNLEESGTLAALRDALLPKLLSGELRVIH